MNCRAATRRWIAALLPVLFWLTGCDDNGSIGPSRIVTFTRIEAGFPQLYLCSFAWGDYDNDGDLDIAVAGQTASGAISEVYRNDAAEFTENSLAVLTGASDCALAWGDHDNDGDLDLVLLGDDGLGAPISGRVFSNVGSQQFIDPGIGLAELAGGCSVAWGDYDNDGDLDLAVAGLDRNMKPTSKILRNGGTGAFSDIHERLEGVGAGCRVAWGDYDNDGDLDLALAGLTTNTPISYIYRNDGARGFVEVDAGLTGVGHGCAIAWGDYDNDGDLDLALAGSAGQSGGVPIRISKIYRNDSGAFVDIGAVMTGVSDCSLAWGDCDNDGDLDIVVAGYAGSDTYFGTVYENVGGTFFDAYPELPGISSGPSVGWGDYDNDGDLDLTLMGYAGAGTYVSTIYRNDGSAPNMAPSTPAGLDSSPGNGEVTFFWDAATDAVTRAPGLTYNLRIGTGPGKDDVMPGMSIIGGEVDGRRLIPAIGNVEHNTSWAVSLPPGTYYWSVQAVDTAFSASPWAPEGTLILP